MTPDSIRTWCDETERAHDTAAPEGKALLFAIWRLRAAADAIERKDVALRVALHGKLTEAAEDIIMAALSSSTTIEAAPTPCQNETPGAS